MAKQFGFGRTEKLKSRKQIEDLFTNGKTFAFSPLRVSYQFFPANGEAVLQAGVTASKRYFKKAVDRNRIKRLIREAYRLQKNPLGEAARQNDRKGFIFFIYSEKNIVPFDVIKTSMLQCLNRLQRKLNEAG